jgi:hypothetical protein
MTETTQQIDPREIIALAPRGAAFFVGRQDGARFGFRHDGERITEIVGDLSRTRAALQAHHARRSKAAKKGAATRSRRRVLKVKQIATRIIEAHPDIHAGPNCCVCGRHITDAESRQRGIGPECWSDVLAAVEAAREAAA